MIRALVPLLAGCGGGVLGYEGHEPPDAGHDTGPDSYDEIVPDGCDHVVAYDKRLAPIDRGEDRYGAAPDPVHVHLSFAADPSTTIAITWQTDEDTRASDVEIGPAGSLIEATGYTFWMQPVLGEPKDGRRIHEVHVCGLEPGTRYLYRVGGPESWSDLRSFRTAPAPGDGSRVTFAVVGDARNNHDIWGDVSEAVETFDPDFVVFTGDAVNWGSEVPEWDNFFGEGESLLAAVPLVPVNGNHEANELPFYAQFAMQGNEQWFDLRYGDLQFVFLNSSPADPETIDGVQRDFLDDALSDPDPIWRFAVHHIPPYSSATMHGPDEGLQEAWVPVFDAHHLDVDLAGHEHVYERTLVLSGGDPVASFAEGTQYTINGGAGADLYGVGKEAWTEVIESVHSYSIVTVEGRTLDWRAFRESDDPDLDGTPLDSFTIWK